MALRFTFAIVDREFSLVTKQSARISTFFIR